MPERIRLPDGRTATTIDLTAGGLRARLTDLGATLMRFETPDRDGRCGNILLGFPTPANYPAAGATGPHVYAGATCGRFANRIAGARFTLDGQVFALSRNAGAHTLHGGSIGFDRALWRIVEARDDAVVMTHHSPDGDQGFPGALDIKARFRLTADGVLAATYSARCDRPTHVNIVAHPYFNLSAGQEPTIVDHRLCIAADAFLPTDPEGVPTGERRAVAGTPFDFTAHRRIGEPDRIDPQVVLARGYNHNFVLPGAGSVREVAWLHHPASGRSLAIATDQPGLQLYSGGFLAAPWRSHAGLCLETQHWPDAPNHPDFPSTRLDSGEVWRAETRWITGVL